MPRGKTTFATWLTTAKQLAGGKIDNCDEEQLTQLALYPHLLVCEGQLFVVKSQLENARTYLVQALRNENDLAITVCRLVFQGALTGFNNAILTLDELKKIQFQTLVADGLRIIALSSAKDSEALGLLKQFKADLSTLK